MELLEQVTINVIANIASSIILLLFASIVYFFVYLRERQQLLRFFGVDKRHKNIRIYVTRMEIQPRGALGFEPVSKGYTGPAIAKVDYDGAMIIRNLLHSMSFSFLPQGIQDWLGDQNLALLAIDPTVDVSPLSLEAIKDANIITLGTGIYNIVSKHYLEHPSCHFIFTKNEQGERVIKIRQGGLKDVEIPGRSENRELGIIQRINDSREHNTIFVCAGLGLSATYGCSRFLVEKWKDIQRKYRNNEFSLCLAFPQQDEDSETVVNPIIVYEWSQKTTQNS